MWPRLPHQLVLFVSSSMHGAIMRARAAVGTTFAASPFIDAWLFESTPASVEAASDVYRHAIIDCDFFLWLVTADLSEIVADEVALALQHNRAILALEIEPDVPRSERTAALLAKVRATEVKTAKQRLDDDFERVIADTLWQQLVDRWRNRPEQGRRYELAMQWRLSVARLVQGWTGLGVSEDVARQLADDATIGGEAGQHSPAPGRPAVLIAGPSGAGKSVLAERLHQIAIRRAADDALAAVPLFVRARDVAMDLEGHVRSRCAPIGEVRDWGVALILDGLSEVTPERARQLAGDAMVLLRGWSGTTIVATSTRETGVSPDFDLSHVSPMGIRAAEALVARLAGSEDYSAYFLPAAVRNAIRLPLYAVLLAGFVRRHGPGRSVSQSELIADIATQSIAGRTVTASAEAALQRAAIAALSTPAVPVSAVLTSAEVNELLGTGLLARDATGDLAFALEIVRAWYAAKALLGGQITPAPSIGRGDEWVDVFALAIAMCTAEGRTALLHQTLRTAPALAFELVPPGASGSIIEPHTLAIGTALRTAHEAIAEGLGPLGPLVVPFGDWQVRRQNERLRLPTLGVHLFGTWLTTGWHVSTEDPPVAEMAAPNWKDPPRDWWPRRERAAEFPGWDPVERALEEWRDWLEAALRSRLLPSPRLDHERIWATARVLIGTQTLYERPISLETLRQRMKPIGTTDFLRHEDYILPFGLLQRTIEQLEATGARTLEPPWPSADLDPPVDGRFYSSELLLARAQRVHEAAIEAYRALVLTFFPTFAARLYHFQVFPARLVGEVMPPPPGTTSDGLVLHWEPLDPHGTSIVTFTLRTEQRPYDAGENERIWDAFRRARPHMRQWPGRGFETMGLWNATPALNIAYEWLWHDLRALHWVVDSRAPEWTIR